MICDNIDLYKYFGIDRKTDGGYITTYVRDRIGEIIPKIRPAMLVIPGGGYSMLSERESEPVALQYMLHGYSAFVLQYSVNTKYPIPLLEACMAVVYLRENAERFFIDKNKIAAIGFSAGGHLAAMLANIYAEKEIEDDLREKTAYAKISALVLSYPVVSLTTHAHIGSRDIITGGDKRLYERLSMEKHVTENSPPAFIWHTVTDDCVPVENSLMLADAYKKAGIPFALHLFERGEHGLSLCNEEVHDQTPKDYKFKNIGKWFDLSLDWLSEHEFTLIGGKAF